MSDSVKRFSATFRIVTKNYFGAWLADRRKAKNLTQDDVAARLGMSRGNYGHFESGRRKVPLTVEQHRTLVRLLDLDGLELLTRQGFEARCPGFENQEEIAVLQAYRRLDPDGRRFLLRGLGL